jgi:hypothetical protein
MLVLVKEMKTGQEMNTDPITAWYEDGTSGGGGLNERRKAGSPSSALGEEGGPALLCFHWAHWSQTTREGGSVPAAIGHLAYLPYVPVLHGPRGGGAPAAAERGDGGDGDAGVGELEAAAQPQAEVDAAARYRRRRRVPLPLRRRRRIRAAVRLDDLRVAGGGVGGRRRRGQDDRAAPGLLGGGERGGEGVLRQFGLQNGWAARAEDAGFLAGDARKRWAQEVLRTRMALGKALGFLMLILCRNEGSFDITWWSRATLVITLASAVGHTFVASNLPPTPASMTAISTLDRAKWSHIAAVAASKAVRVSDPHASDTSNTDSCHRSAFFLVSSKSSRFVKILTESDHRKRCGDVYVPTL